MYIKQPHHPNFAKSYSFIIGAFHRALGGRMFGHKLQEDGDNVAWPIASEYSIGLRPSHSNPQFKKTSIKTNQNCPTNISTFSQFGAQKDEENIPMGS